MFKIYIHGEINGDPITLCTGKEYKFVTYMHRVTTEIDGVLLKVDDDKFIVNIYRGEAYIPFDIVTEIQEIN